MDVYEEEFGGICVTGAEGWSAQQGESSLNSRVDEDNEDEVDSVDIDMSLPETQSQAVEIQTQPGSSRKRRHKEKDEVDSVDIDMSVPETQTQAVEIQTQPGSSRKRRHKEKDVVIETSVARNTILAQKNKIAEQMLEREYASSVERVVEILNELHGVRKWSLFHRASIDHLLADAVNRQGFVAFSSVEDKISYLEHRTGKKLYD